MSRSVNSNVRHLILWVFVRDAMYGPIIMEGTVNFPWPYWVLLTLVVVVWELYLVNNNYWGIRRVNMITKLLHPAVCFAVLSNSCFWKYWQNPCYGDLLCCDALLAVCVYLCTLYSAHPCLSFFSFNGVTIQATRYSTNTAFSWPGLLLFVIRTSVLLQLSTFGIGTSC